MYVLPDNTIFLLRKDYVITRDSEYVVTYTERESLGEFLSRHVNTADSYICVQAWRDKYVGFIYSMIDFTTFCMRAGLTPYATLAEEDVEFYRIGDQIFMRYTTVSEDGYSTEWKLKEFTCEALIRSIQPLIS